MLDTQFLDFVKSTANSNATGLDEFKEVLEGVRPFASADVASFSDSGLATYAQALGMATKALVEIKTVMNNTSDAILGTADLVVVAEYNSVIDEIVESYSSGA